MKKLEMKKPDEGSINASIMECGTNGQLHIDKSPC